MAGVPGLEPRLTGPEPVGLPITPHPIPGHRPRRPCTGTSAPALVPRRRDPDPHAHHQAPTSSLSMVWSGAVAVSATARCRSAAVEAPRPGGWLPAGTGKRQTLRRVAELAGGLSGGGGGE